MQPREPESSPATQIAYDYVKSNIVKGTWREGERLPPVRKLAVSASVSPRTMARAVSLLKNDGLIGGIERSRLYAGSSVLETEAPTETFQPHWQMVRRRLEQDILSGTYAEDRTLPRLKELRINYGACFRTLRKVLQSLAADKVVFLKNKRYELQTYSARSFSQRIVLITSSMQVRPQSALNQGQYRIFDLLEHECNRRGLRITIVEIDLYNPVETRRALLDDAVTAPAMGYFMDRQWSAGEGAISSLTYLLARLSALKRPVAILDEVGDFNIPFRVSVNPLIQVFRIQGKRGGNLVARFLLGMRHRNIVYISSTHEAQWSRQRLEGIIEEYSKAGQGKSVMDVVGENLEISHEYVLAVSGFDEALIRRMLAVSKTKLESENSYKDFLRYKQSFSPEQFAPEHIRDIKNQLKIVRDLADRTPDKALFDAMCTEIYAGIGRRVNMKVRAPLFEQALSNRSATAWVCANDGTALTALAFLRERTISVPQRISVVGFDNIPVQALENRLTSFDFNAAGFVHRMLNFIARPPRPRGPYRHVPIEVEGVVMQRGTTAPPKETGSPFS